MSAETVPTGSVLERVYYASPSDYGFGEPRETFRAALVDGIERMIRIRDTYLLSYTPAEQAHPNFVPMPERVTVDTRWVMSYPEWNAVQGSVDLVVERTSFPSIAAANETLARIPVPA